jgi:hypothetical protein
MNERAHRGAMTKVQKQNYLKQQLQAQIQTKKTADEVARFQEIEIDRVNLERQNIELSIEKSKQRQ